ncbi:MAG: DNA replication/repair protein RecF [Candidatus Poribacteria bacterium]|nr:DNA replication/repair protein RecF [Candidatus Poribacteria bacterium]
MLLSHIVLRNFRNYIDCEVNFPKPVNLIIGGNAQGKTSLLEAIYFLCTAESHRATRDGELIRHNEAGFYLRGTLKNSRDDVMSLEATKRARGEFKLKKNGILQTKRSEWIGQFNAVLFSPESLVLVKGGPAERRRFLDLLISQIDSSYLKNLQEYRLVLKQRNELLKQIRMMLADTVQLDVWDKLLIAHGTAIIVKRLEIFHQLRVYAMQNHQRLTGDQENLALTYRSALVRNDTSTSDVEDETTENLINEAENELDESESEIKVAKHFGEALSASRSADLQRGTTLVGPHRDDFLIELENTFETHHPNSQGENSAKVSEIPEVETEDQEDTASKPFSPMLPEATTLQTGEIFREGARAYGSQGQQRTIALALKLAELELIRAVTGRDPIVLLDDVTSELDYKRTGYLLKVLQNLSAQTFITATHTEPLVHHLNQPNVLTVENAQISCTPETSEKS